MNKNFPRRVHFVGIGGIGMSGLAKHLLKIGCEVSGSDRQENSQTKKLRKLGAHVTVPHAESSVGDAELVVKTSAVDETNCEIVAAKKRGIPVILREQLLGQIFDGFPTRIAVCGTHGKTTVTAMIHHILWRCGIPHTAFIGGEYKGENYFCCGKPLGRTSKQPSRNEESRDMCLTKPVFGKIVVAEACEYNRSFLNLHPTLCVCLNVEFDHPDCYLDVVDVEKAFSEFFSQSQNVAINRKYGKLCPDAFKFGIADCNVSENCVEGADEEFGSVYKEETNQNDILATGIVLKSNGGFKFDFACGGEQIPCELNICGRHNIQNACAALAVARYLGLPMLQAAQALSTFGGVDRRWTTVRFCPDVVCDYAHHPTEIAAAVQTAKTMAKSHIYCVFQPHTYSRTKAFLPQFVECFAGVDCLVILPVYSAREKSSDGATAFRLFKLAKQTLPSVKYFSTFYRAADFLKRNVKTDDLILLVGAGDVNGLADYLG